MIFKSVLVLFIYHIVALLIGYRLINFNTDVLLKVPMGSIVVVSGVFFVILVFMIFFLKRLKKITDIPPEKLERETIDQAVMYIDLFPAVFTFLVTLNIISFCTFLYMIPKLTRTGYDFSSVALGLVMTTVPLGMYAFWSFTLALMPTRENGFWKKKVKKVCGIRCRLIVIVALVSLPFGIWYAGQKFLKIQLDLSYALYMSATSLLVWLVFFPNSISHAINLIRFTVRDMAKDSGRIKIPVTRKDEIGVLQSEVSESIDRFVKAVKLKFMLGGFVPKDTASFVESKNFFIGSNKRTSVILLVKLFGISELSQKVPEDKLINMLTAFWNDAQRTVINRGGVIERVLPDELLALFGTPVEIGEHSYRAVKTAVDFMSSTEGMMSYIKNEYGFEPKLGVVVHSGLTIFGSSDILGTGMNKFLAFGKGIDEAFTIINVFKKVPSGVFSTKDVYSLTADRFTYGKEFKLRTSIGTFEIHEVKV